MKKPIVLTIIDGLGYDENIIANAWKLANTPTLDDLIKNFPNTILEAAGPAVGLPIGQIGNSEVGHLNIGAGQIVYTGLSLIKKAIDEKTFKTNKAFVKTFDHVKQNNSTLHLMGLVSSGGVHSLQTHLFEIIDASIENGIKNIMIHAFADGRDVAPKTFNQDIKKLMDIIQKKQSKNINIQIASIQGRLYAMDRDAMFAKTEKAFNALRGTADNSYLSPIDYVLEQYETGLVDEFIEPAINKNLNSKFLTDNDGIIFFNFRPDRARQLCHLLVGSSLYDQPINHPLKNIQLTTMMKYAGIKKADVAFDSMVVENTLGSVVANADLKQIRIAETQKYAHVTFFMDGGLDIELKNAKRILVPSLKIDNFAKSPEMSAKEITQKIIPELANTDLVIMNFANPDMVGHTGSLEATIKAVEIIDHEIKKLKTAVDKVGGIMFITADHGNAELMKNSEGEVVTKHTTNNVPFIATSKMIKFVKGGSLANVAPTILDYMNLKKPQSMDHDSLIKKN